MARTSQTDLTSASGSGEGIGGRLQSEIETLLASLDLSANGLLVTLFSDVVLPRGGTIWLGDLINLAAPFGVKDRPVRTGVYRLTQEGWLASTLQGRRAYYRFTDWGREKTEDEQRRIYTSTPVLWDGRWHFVQMLPSMTKAERARLLRRFKALGFGQIVPGLLAHPAVSTNVVHGTLQDMKLNAKTLAFGALTEEFITMETLTSVARQAWDLTQLNAEYADFLKRFETLNVLCQGRGDISGKMAFLFRTLLINDHRRMLLKDPQLPDAFLPKKWNGGEARALCARLYGSLTPAADSYISSQLEAGGDGNADLTPNYWGRFGGIGTS